VADHNLAITITIIVTRRISFSSRSRSSGRGGLLGTIIFVTTKEEVVFLGMQQQKLLCRWYN